MCAWRAWRLPKPIKKEVVRKQQMQQQQQQNTTRGNGQEKTLYVNWS
jgi:hypothetical protein